MVFNTPRYSAPRRWKNRASLEERFAKHVDTNGPMHPYNSELGPCHIWKGSKYKNGYGVMRTGYHLDRKMTGAHRVAFELMHGPIRVDMLVCHSCDNPLCVNAVHLFEGTAKDNSHDSARKGRNGGGFIKYSLETRKAIVKRTLELPHTTENITAIAKEFNVSHGTVYQVYRGDLYQALKEDHLLKAA